MKGDSPAMKALHAMHHITTEPEHLFDDDAVGGFNAIVFGEELEATDIIASVDGNPVYVGELNLILAERFPNQPIDSIDIDLKRATCHVLRTTPPGIASFAKSRWSVLSTDG